jgi:hypothetical protein
MRRSPGLCTTRALMLAATLAMAANVRGQQATPLPQVSAERLAIAESVVAQEEAASKRAFDPSFHAKTLEKLAALPMDALIQAQSRDNGGLGLNALGDSQADLVYTPVTPCRIIDTRIVGGVIAAGTTTSFLVTGTDLSSQGGSATGCGVSTVPRLRRWSTSWRSTLPGRATSRPPLMDPPYPLRASSTSGRG